MASKQDILQHIRRQIVPAAELPSLAEPWITYPDRRRQFASMIEAVGGQCVVVPDLAGADAHLQNLPAYTSAKKTCSLVAGVGQSNVDLAMIDDPHTVEDVDVAIVRGELGVAENGAVWVHESSLRHRALWFIVQHLVFVLDAHALLDNMHQAYERLSFGAPGFGVFISGPSKTADIEQSLVIGAHGPRSLTVLLVEGRGAGD